MLVWQLCELFTYWVDREVERVAKLAWISSVLLEWQTPEIVSLRSLQNKETAEILQARVQFHVFDLSWGKDSQSHSTKND